MLMMLSLYMYINKIKIQDAIYDIESKLRIWVAFGFRWKIVCGFVLLLKAKICYNFAMLSLPPTFLHKNFRNWGILTISFFKKIKSVAIHILFLLNTFTYVSGYVFSKTWGPPQKLIY